MEIIVSLKRSWVEKKPCLNRRWIDEKFLVK
jgi:hypothetical protein